MLADDILKKIFTPPKANYSLTTPFLPSSFLLTQSQIDQLSLAKFLPLLVEQGSPQGDAHLRTEIANDLKQRFAFDCKPEWVVTTNGSQQAIDTLMRSFDGNCVVGEEPGYAYTSACAQVAGHRMVTLPYSPDFKIDWALWERRLQSAGPNALVYIMLRHSNPLGRSFSDDEVQSFTTLLKSHRGPIVYDAWMDELDFHLTKHKINFSSPHIRLGSMTKKLFPGLRVGYAVIPDETLRERFIGLKRIGSGSVPLLAEKIVCEVFASKLWDEHLRVLARRLHSRFEHFFSTLSGCASILPIEGGIASWVRPHNGIEPEALNEKLLPYDLNIRLPRSWSISGATPPPGFSLCYPRVDDEALQILKNVFSKP